MPVPIPGAKNPPPEVTGLNAGDEENSVSGFALWFTPTYSSSRNTKTIDSSGYYDEENIKSEITEFNEISYRVATK